MLLSLTASLAYAIMHNLIYSRQYLNFQVDLFFGPGLARVMAMAGAGAMVVVLAMLLHPEPFLKLRQVIRERSWHVARMLFIVSSILVVAFLLLWPVLWPPFADWGDPRWSLLYWTLPGLALAVVGLALFVVRRKEKIALPFWATSLANLVLYMSNPFIEPLQPWASRRLCNKCEGSGFLPTCFFFQKSLAVRRRRGPDQR